MKKLCVNGYKNYVKSRPSASKDSVRRSKNIDLEKMRPHPSLTRTFGAESERLAFISKMKNYKPKMVTKKQFHLGSFDENIESHFTNWFADYFRIRTIFKFGHVIIIATISQNK